MIRTRTTKPKREISTMCQADGEKVSNSLIAPFNHDRKK